ncbi:PIN domain-containing protein [Nocardia cyriacigeorgica]|uniref:type II toxin-antitoxin system VapC family toxin n=1 Tax=Nocardia cyriacigeorgica TaxID=135487 RepID=UPI0018962B63|nr:TA system VapC family ribonuclease toxin [Nocardia cyriacigeorgica]MBF6082911.1 PIN domain-containing protein [Nocardia cyriacigeorgica]MBF6427244.1 PIN domain-containing protein [Nocardia cyriacigeorgica]BDU05208.1 ribonuclease VapC43 [Nocardia cyriacigeorgica]
MIAVDTNLLVYAHRKDSPFHEAAAARVRELAESPAQWAIPWPCLHEFYSIATHPRIYSPPSTADQAIDQIEAWLGSPTLILLAESEMHWTVLRALLLDGAVQGPMVHDARIAALCVGHGVRELWSADRDFSRFPRLTTRNPLI